MARFPGPFCEKMGLTKTSILEETIQIHQPVILQNGHIIELKKFADICKISTTKLLKWLNAIDHKTCQIKPGTLTARIKRVLETNKKLLHKKKVPNYSSVVDFQSSPFNPVLAPTAKTVETVTSVLSSKSHVDQSSPPTSDCSPIPTIETVSVTSDLNSKLDPSYPPPSTVDSKAPTVETVTSDSSEVSSKSHVNQSCPPTSDCSPIPTIETVSVTSDLNSKLDPSYPPPTTVDSKSPTVETVTSEVSSKLLVDQSCPPTTDCSNAPTIESVNPVLVPRTKTMSVDLRTKNMLHYEIGKSQKVLGRLQTLIDSERENLNLFKSRKGHFSVRNVTKRDNLAATNRKLLRETQTALAKQTQLIERIEQCNLQLQRANKRLQDELTDARNTGNEKMAKQPDNQLKKKMLNNEVYVENLLTENESLRKQVNHQLSSKLNAKRSVKYLKKNVQRLRTDLKSNENFKQLKKTIETKNQEIDQLRILYESLKDDKIDKYGTRNSDGSFKGNIRLCVIELAGLEVATEKISPVIQVVSKHVHSCDINHSDLPTSSTVQSILDEGHYLAKTYISTVIDAAGSFGINRDGTTRKKRKIVDTSITLDTGDVMSLGFTHVAHETAKTINTVTKRNISELAQLNNTLENSQRESATCEEYIRNTLCKLAYSMSDRASNEKLADKLLDEWRDDILKNCSNDEVQTVKHFHCMAHVLLGFHNYACKDVKLFEASLVELSGPLGRDCLPAFKYWRTTGTVIERVVRTTSETFGPSGDHLGLRDRWDAYCGVKGIKSILGNYRDNRFNGIFQTSAEVLVHADDMLEVLNTVQNPNRKLQAVKSDLQCERIRGLLMCFALFYVKVTGPYWNLVTSDIPYLLLYKHIQTLNGFLKSCCANPSNLLNPDGHWDANDEHGFSDIPYRQRFIDIQFKTPPTTDLYDIIKVVSAAMVKCIEKQLVDFLPGGQFSEQPCPEDLKRTGFAHTTNLACEHHFGDLDSSQKRRPNASMHHHSTVQLLKRNRKPMLKWLSKMSQTEQKQVLKKARHGGRELRIKHLNDEKEVSAEIHDDMIKEKDKKNKKQCGKRKRKDVNNDIQDDETLNDDDVIAPISDKLNDNEYVVVAYQDSWYPGCIESTSDEQIIINFMCPTRKPGHFVWPNRKDVQTVNKEFIIQSSFIPECLNSGRLWKIPDFDKINALYKKYCKVYF